MKMADVVPGNAFFLSWKCKPVIVIWHNNPMIEIACFDDYYNKYRARIYSIKLFDFDYSKNIELIECRFEIIGTKKIADVSFGDIFWDNTKVPMMFIDNKDFSPNKSKYKKVFFLSDYLEENYNKAEIQLTSRSHHNAGDKAYARTDLDYEVSILKPVFSSDGLLS